MASQSQFFTGREAPPQHLSFRIESFSNLSQFSIESVSSSQFESAGYQWKMVIYPKGKLGDGDGHISIYLELADTETLPAGWQINAIFNIFVFNHITDEYFSFNDGRLRRFHSMKTQRGYPKFIAIPTFTDPSNGFLEDDNCVFGAEVTVLKEPCKGERLSLMITPCLIAKHTWKISNFSTLANDVLDSESFEGGSYLWYIQFYPNGTGDGKGNSISVSLSIKKFTLPPNTSVCVEYVLRILNQSNAANDDSVRDVDIFRHSKSFWQYPMFMPLAKFKDPNEGFLVDNSCTLEAEITLLGTTSPIS